MTSHEAEIRFMVRLVAERTTPTAAHNGICAAPRRASKSYRIVPVAQQCAFAVAPPFTALAFAAALTQRTIDSNARSRAPTATPCFAHNGGRSPRFLWSGEAPNTQRRRNSPLHSLHYSLPFHCIAFHAHTRTCTYEYVNLLQGYLQAKEVEQDTCSYSF